MPGPSSQPAQAVWPQHKAAVQWPQEPKLNPSWQWFSRGVPALRFFQRVNERGKRELPNPPSLALQEHRTSEFSEMLWKLSRKPSVGYTPPWKQAFALYLNILISPTLYSTELAGLRGEAQARVGRRCYNEAEGCCTFIWLRAENNMQALCGIDSPLTPTMPGWAVVQYFDRLVHCLQTGTLSVVQAQSHGAWESIPFSLSFTPSLVPASFLPSLFSVEKVRGAKSVCRIRRQRPITIIPTRS